MDKQFKQRTKSFAAQIQLEWRINCPCCGYNFRATPETHGKEFICPNPDCGKLLLGIYPKLG